MIRNFLAEASFLSTPNGNIAQIEEKNQVIWQWDDVPIEWQPVQWIQAAANVQAYFDLGFAFDTAATIYISLWGHGSSTATYPFGAVENSGKNRCCLSCPYSAATTGTFYGSNGTDYNGTTVKDISTNRNDLKLTIKKGELSALNLTTNTTAGVVKNQVAYTMTSNLYLFAQNYNGAPRFGGARKIAELKYYDKNNILICDIVPCYNKKTNEIRLYDRARKIFLIKQGSGSFTKGPDLI